jgi:hypothetical protein
MTEKDFILATDLRSVGNALQCLREVMPTLNPHIEGSEYVEVMRTLKKWQEAMGEAIRKIIK